MNVISTLPRWASSPLQKIADKESVPGTQQLPLEAAPQLVDQVSQMGMGVMNMVAMDEQPGEDLAMGQPGVVVPQEGIVVRFEGDVTKAEGTVEAVVDATDEGQAVYVRRDGSKGLDTVIIAKDPQGTVAQGVFLEQSPLGMDGYIVAGQVG